MTKIIGVTGGIGSGKTSLMQYAEQQGYRTYYSDIEAKKLYDKPHIINSLKEVFKGEDIWTAGALDKKKLAQVVFSDQEKLSQLNQIIHPAVRQDFEDFANNYHNEPVILKESALLFETGAYESCDYNILITAPEDIRIQRVIDRDKVSREQVLNRMKNQWSDEKKEKLADFVIQNIVLEEAQQAFLNILKQISR